jgi:hypothetical protein
MSKLNFIVSAVDGDLLYRIAIRASHLAQSHGQDYPIADALMDLTACHVNACRLQLAELAQAPNLDFSHDVFGIQRHLNRDTGKLENCFTPRYADRLKKFL